MFKLVLLLLLMVGSFQAATQTPDTIFPFEKEFHGIHVLEYNIPPINRDEGSYYPILECGYCWQCGIRTEDTIPQKYNKYRIGIVNNLYGVFSEKGAEIIAPVYDSLHQVYAVIQSAFIVLKNGKYGLVEEDNQVIYPPVYDEFQPLSRGIKCHHIGGLFYVRKGDQKGLLRVDGTSKVKVRYDYVNFSYYEKECPSMRPLVCVGLDGKYGFVDDKDSAVVPIMYEDILTRRPHSKYKDKIIAKHNGKYGVIDNSNKTIIPFKYENIQFHDLEGYDMPLAVKLNHKWGLITSNDRPIFEPKFDSILYLEYAAAGKFAFLHNDQWGVSDTNGNVVVKATFKNIEALEGDYYIYSENNKKGFISSTGEVLSAPIYDGIQDVSKHLALVTKDQYKGIFNLRSGKEIVPPAYTIPWHYYGEYDLFWDVYLYTDQMVWKDSTEHYGLIDSSGNTTIPFEFDQPLEIEAWENRVIGEKEGKKYLFDWSGHLIVGPLDQIMTEDYLRSDFCVVKKDSLYGLISPENKILLETQYDRITREYDRSNYKSDSIFFEVEKNEKVGIVNKNGIFIIPCEYSHIEYDDGIFNVVKGLKTAGLFYDGTIESPFDFNISEKLSSEYREVKYGGQIAVIDRDGNRVDHEEYDYYKRLKNDYIMVRQKSKKKAGSHYEYRYGLLDTNLEVFLPVIYEDLQFYRDDFGSVRDTNSRYHFYDFKTGIHETHYLEIRYFPMGYFEVEASEYVEGICDTMGNIIIEPQFQKIKYYDKTWGAVKKNGIYGFCDGKGHMIVDYKYEKVKGVYKNFVTVRLNNKYGVVTRSGDIIIPFQYKKKVKFDQLTSIPKFFINVESEEGHGLLDSNMNEVIPSICSHPIKAFKKAGDLQYTIIKTNDKRSGIYLSSGKNLAPIAHHHFNDSFLSTTRLFKYSRNGKHGLINHKGKVVLPPKYDSIIGNIEGYSSNFSWDQPQPYLIYQHKKKYGIISRQGKKITPAKYSRYSIRENGKLSFTKKSSTYFLNENGKLKQDK